MLINYKKWQEEHHKKTTLTVMAKAGVSDSLNPSLKAEVKYFLFTWLLL